MSRKQKRTPEQTASLFADITILPIYRMCKVFASKTPFKESFNEEKSHFIFDILCTGLLLYIIYWIGSWNILGHHFHSFWWFGVGILGVMVLCYSIGKWRRKHKPITLQEQIFTEEKRQRFSKVPKVKFTHSPINVEPEIETEANYNEVLDALSSLGYNSSEAKNGADFAENNNPDGNTEEKIIDSLRFFNEKLAV
jgi:hypothetical protein